MLNPEYSQEQADRINNGWNEAEAASLEAQYPNLSNNDLCDAEQNVNESVRDDYDINNNVSIMELYASSLEGIAESK